MSERLTSHHEHNLTTPEVSQEVRQNIEKLQQEAFEAVASAEKTDIEALQTTAEQKAISADEITVGEQESEKPTHFAAHKAHKAEAYAKTMQRVQSRLSGPERTLSKFSHQPKIEAISNVASKTVTRASGILGSGVFALFGGVFLLFLSRQYGYAYNYTSFLALVVIGYFSGLLVELCVRTFKRNK